MNGHRRCPFVGTRDDSDGAYVVGLCSKVLGEAALAQHKFDWLLGDPGTSGRRAKLPVDAYWPGHQLVVEYRELQHDQSMPGVTRRSPPTGYGLSSSAPPASTWRVAGGCAAAPL